MPRHCEAAPPAPLPPEIAAAALPGELNDPEFHALVQQALQAGYSPQQVAQIIRGQRNMEESLDTHQPPGY